MAVHYYITGRERKVRRRVDFTMPCTIVYNAWSRSNPATYFADYSTALGGTVIPSWVWDSGTLTYGALFYKTLISPTFVPFGSIAVAHPGTGSGPGGDPTDAEYAAGCSAISYTITGYWDREHDAAEVAVIANQFQYYEVLKPGGLIKSTVSVGGESHVVSSTTADWAIANFPDYLLGFSLSVNRYNYWNGSRDPAFGWTPTLLALLDAACAGFAAGTLTAVANAHYAGTPGMVDASGLSLSSAYGSASWGSLVVSAPPAGARHTATLEGEGIGPHTLAITGKIRRWRDENDQSCDVVLLINTEITNPSQWPIVTSVEDSFTHNAPGGGYQMDGEWIRAYISGSPSLAFDSDSDSTVPSSPVAGFIARAAIRSQGPGTLPTGFWAAPLHPLMARHPAKVPVMRIKSLPEKDLEGRAGTPWSIGSLESDKWTATNAVASVVGGVMRFTPSSAWGGISKEFDTVAAPPIGQRWIGYRYWRFRIRSVGSANNTLRFSFLPGDLGWWYEATTGADGEWVERTIDLFSDPESTGSTFCRIEPFHKIDGYVLRGENGITYEVEWFQGVRLHDALLTHTRVGVVGQGFSPIHGFVDGMGSFRPLFGLYGVSPALTTIESIKTYTEMFMPWLGWAFDVLRTEPADTFLPLSELGDVGAGWTLSNALGLFADDSLYEDVDATGAGATWYYSAAATSVQTYPGAGDVLNGGDYDATIPLRFSILMHAQLFGCIVPASGGVDAEEVDTSDPSGSGSARPSGFYATGSPYLRVDMPAPPATAVEQQAESTETLRYWDDFLVRAVPPQPDREVQPVPMAPTGHGVRYYLRFHVSPDSGQVIVVDTIRGWLHVGVEKKIRTYHLQTLVLAFDSADHPVDSWAGLATDARTGALYLLGVDGSDYVVFRSFDGGVSIEEVLTVTADSAQIVCDPNRGWLILLYEDGGDIQRRVSRDGGENWDAADDVLFDGLAESGVVMDMTVDPRAAGQLALIADIGGVKIYRSFDGGESWETAIS